MNAVIAWTAALLLPLLMRLFVLQRHLRPSRAFGVALGLGLLSGELLGGPAAGWIAFVLAYPILSGFKPEPNASSPKEPGRIAAGLGMIFLLMLLSSLYVATTALLER